MNTKDALFTLACLAAGALLLHASDTGDARSGQLQDIVVEGTSRLQIKSDKPAEIVEMDPRRSVEQFIMAYMRENNPTHALSYSFPLYLPSRIASTAVTSPWRGRLMEAPILSLVVKVPPRVTVAKWRLVITGDDGKIFRTMKGKGALPRNIVWDGLSDSGQLLHVAHPYSYALSVLDEYEIPKYLFGKSVTVTGFAYEAGGRLTMLVDTNFMFTKGPGFSPRGRVCAREAQDRLNKIAIEAWKISVKVYGSDQDLAQKEADLLKDYLEEALYLEKGAIHAKGSPPDADNYARTEIVAVER